MDYLNIQGEEFLILSTKEKITIADSFVVRQNKIGSGNGEAKLYVGNEGEEVREFFGKIGFNVRCFLLKKDLIRYLDETRAEYTNPEQPYLNKEILPSLWKERREKVDSMPHLIEFDASEQIQISGPRIYINSSNKIAYNLVRELSLPNITYISAIKLRNKKGEIVYYFRLFADYFGEAVHPYIIKKENKEIENATSDKLEKTKLYKARVGQGEYRKKLLELCPFCPITLVSDDRLLIASHIKPWSVSDNFEKTDAMNGFMLTPTFDYLFDRGFLSFTDDKKTILSPFLSKMTYSKIGISDNKTIPHLQVEGHEKYLEFHRNNIFK
jgi:putative restriction endonuclease